MPDSSNVIPPGRHLRPVDSSSGQLVAYRPELQSHPDQDEGIDLLELWRTVLKRKWVVVAIAAIFLVTALLATALTVPVYRSTAIVQINHESAQILGIRDFESGPRSWQGVEAFYTTQYEILRSRALAEAVVRSEGVENHPELTGELRQRSLTGELRALPGTLASFFRRGADAGTQGSTSHNPGVSSDAAVRRAGARLRSRITVSPVRNSRLVNVSVASFDPEFASRMANAVVEEYIRSSMQRRYDAGTEAREFLQEQLQEMRIALERSDQALSDFAQSNRIANLEERLDLASTGLRQLNSQLNDVQSDLVRYSTYREQMQRGQIEFLEPIRNNDNIRRLRTQHQDLSTEYGTLSQRFMEEYPALVELRSRMARLQEQIDEETQSALRAITGRYSNLLAQQEALERAIEEREAGILALNQRSVQYNILRREFETNRELYDGLLQRMKEIGVAAGLRENNIAVVENAMPVRRPFLPNWNRNIGLALLLGMMVGVGLALILEFIDTTIRRTEDLERLTGRPVLGLVPMVRGKDLTDDDRKSVNPDRAVGHYSARHPKSAVSEAFRSLRTSLMFSTPEGMPKTLLITSPGPGDGKTTTAINLATVMAQNGARVLLIDADLRKPRLHRDFAKPQGPGLTNRIARVGGNGANQSAIVPTDVKRLFLMPSGGKAPNPAELLSSARMDKIIEMAGRVFDHIIIDTAPILGLADSMVLSRKVDGVIMVTSAGRTSKDSIRVGVKRMFQVQAPLLGVVLNAVDLQSPDYAYYSSYYYNYDGDTLEEQRKAIGRIA